MADTPLPDFIIIGAQRSATRWLRSNLDRHPDIFLPSFELSYFDRGHGSRRRTITWYQKQFDAWDGEAHVGESSFTYMLPSSRPYLVARAMDEALPGVKVIAVLRDPVERMHSAMISHIKRGRLPADADLFSLIEKNDPAVAELDLVSAGRYAEILHPFLRRFGSRVLVVLHADVRDRPESVYAEVCAHLGASTDFVPRDLGKVLHSNRTSVRAAPVTDEQRRILFNDLFRSDVEELQEMVEPDVSIWDPGPRPLEPPWGGAPRVGEALDDGLDDEDDDEEAEPDEDASAELDGDADR